MNDSQFLSYCDGMLATPRCGFVSQSLLRLAMLAGDEEEAQACRAMSANTIIGYQHERIRSLVERARARPGV